MPQRRKPSPPPIEIREFTLEGIKIGIQKLNRRIKEVGNLDPGSIRFDDAKVSTVEQNIQNVILEIFGLNSPEFQKYQNYEIWHDECNFMDSDDWEQATFAAGIPQTVTMLEGLISRLKEKGEYLAAEQTMKPNSRDVLLKKSRQIFIVHGHDEANTLKLEKLLKERWKLEPIILREKPAKGRTLIEKFEQEAQAVTYAFVLFTPDDLIEVPDKKYAQARPNAIFELGWFYGRLNRKRVCILFKKGTKIHSDLDGIIRIEFDNSIEEKIVEIERELTATNLI